MKTIQFGNKNTEYEYFDRRGVYAILISDENKIGIVEVNEFFFLAGGGIEKNENECKALLREIREETGFKAKVGRHLGNANEFQISFDKKMKFNQIGSFYMCSITADHQDQSDISHKFKWVSINDAKSKIIRKSHWWALMLALHNFDEFHIENRQGIYRLIHDNELALLLNLYKHLHVKDSKPDNAEEFTNVWNAIIADSNILYFVAEINGELIASCHLSITPNLTRGCKPYGVIENVVTHKDFRGKGIGKGILKYAKNVAWVMGCYKVMLMTGSKKEWVHQFYENAGFQKNIKTAFHAKP